MVVKKQTKKSETFNKFNEIKTDKEIIADSISYCRQRANECRERNLQLISVFKDYLVKVDLLKTRDFRACISYLLDLIDELKSAVKENDSTLKLVINELEHLQRLLDSK